MSDQRTRYRDSTYSATTQETLRDLREWLLQANLRLWAEALEDVICRWDANDATEVKL